MKGYIIEFRGEIVLLGPLEVLSQTVKGIERLVGCASYVIASFGVCSCFDNLVAAVRVKPQLEFASCKKLLNGDCHKSYSFRREHC